MLLAMLLIGIGSVKAWHCIEGTDGSVSGWFDIIDAGDNKTEEWLPDQTILDHNDAGQNIQRYLSSVLSALQWFLSVQGYTLYGNGKRSESKFEDRISWTDLERDNEYMEKVRAELNEEQWEIRSNFTLNSMSLTGPASGYKTSPPIESLVL